MIFEAVVSNVMLGQVSSCCDTMSHPHPGLLLFIAFVVFLAPPSGVLGVYMLPSLDVPAMAGCHPWFLN